MRWSIFGGVFEYLFLLITFGAYIFMLVWIVIDLFRDHRLNGWWKALWIAFLVFVPFLTAFVYLLARGSGMADRAQRRPEKDAVARTVRSTNPSDEIAKAKALLDRGVLSPSEFDVLKAKALASRH